MKVTVDNIGQIVFFRTSRSSGAGGQAVNKLETKVEVLCNIDSLEMLNEKELELIRDRLKNRINRDGNLSVSCSDSRSQSQNKSIALKRMVDLLNEAIKVEPKRKPTKPSKSARAKRLDEKTKHSETKARRRWKLD